MAGNTLEKVETTILGDTEYFSLVCHEPHDNTHLGDNKGACDFRVT